jgi:ABC-type phosphate transport system auxiliary subunit
MSNIPQKDEEEKVKEAVAAFDDFMSTMDDLSKTQLTVINETNRQLELEKIETLKKQINEEK